MRLDATIYQINNFDRIINYKELWAEIILKINNSLNVSLDSNSEFDRDFANKINSAIPIKATIVITYLNLIYLC